MAKIKNDKKEINRSTRREINFGTRKIISQNDSRLISITRAAREILGLTDDSYVTITVVIEDEPYIKITAVKNQAVKIEGDPSSMIGGS